MGLRSQLFAGDPALEACLAKDSAHVTQGARGPHVNKIHRALVTADGAAIAADELVAKLYGRSTAAAVLAYKRKRNIINLAYQRTADDIVGKMTIVALDADMVKAESSPPIMTCSDPELARGPRILDRQNGGGNSPQSGGLRLAFSVSEGDAAGPKFPATLRVAFQLAATDKTTGLRNEHLFRTAHPKRANELLAPYDMRLITSEHGLFVFPFNVDPRSSADVEALRKAAEKHTPGLSGAVRVIICDFEERDGSNAVTAGRSTFVDGFPNFILLNSRRHRADNGTLLHEMIHASAEKFMGDFAHDTDDDTSIFSWGLNRTVLKSTHAESLSKAFFASRA